MFKMIALPRVLHSHISRKLYHDSRFSPRTPIIRAANARVSNTLKRQADRNVKPEVKDFNPSRRLEPFPYAITEDNKFDTIRRIVSPLITAPYEEQLASKEAHCRNSLRYLAQQLYKNSTPIRLDVRRLPCQVNTIVRAPQLYHYRNKDEFSIWRGYDKKTLTVGFVAFPISKHGDTVCVEPEGCEVMKEDVGKLTKVLQEFIRNQAKLPVCYSLGLEGGWRRFTVRSNIQNEIMLIGIASPRTLKVRDIIDERENFKNYIVQRTKEEGINLESLYFQPCPHSMCRDKDVPFELLYGEKTITETISGLKFVISPESFIHQNTSGSEVLFRTVKETIKDCFSIKENSSEKPLVLSANCGVGTAALHLAQLASRVIGIDSSEQAIRDAQTNAFKNSISNCEFICSNLEIILEKLLVKYSRLSKDILTICTPSKTGLHSNTISTLRDCRNVKKIVYVTSKIDAPAVIDNLVILCSKKSGGSPPPFAPISVSPVDMYPHVESYESIIVLERLPE